MALTTEWLGHKRIEYTHKDFVEGQQVRLRKGVAKRAGCEVHAVVITSHAPGSAIAFPDGGLALSVQTKRGKGRMVFDFDEVDPCIPVVPMSR